MSVVDPIAVVDPMALAGRWSIRRHVADRRTGEHGQLTGTLTVRPATDGLEWVEQGTLWWAGRALPAGRTLGLRVLDGQWWMTFADGSPFHPWQPGEPVVHPCRADHYIGVVDLDASGASMRILWRVEGPAKRQRIFSRYQRLRHR